MIAYAIMMARINSIVEFVGLEPKSKLISKLIYFCFPSKTWASVAFIFEGTLQIILVITAGQKIQFLIRSLPGFYNEQV